MLYNCLIVVLVFIDVSYAQQTITVNIKDGKITGTKKTYEGKDVNEFLGIPYAEPPIGELRFKKPLPLRHPFQSYDATHWPNPCIQDTFWESTLLNKNYSEDCLYLNIWSPIDIISNADTLKPVMFWIHGGGITIGSSNQFIYKGEILSTKGGVVVVTINYRLNVFGFLYTGTDDAPGNVGLWDQALALEWVNDNIRYFGGDPQRITIFGESAGSWSVSLLLLSPITQNMYENAIMMSGAVVNSEMIEESNASKTKWLTGAKLIGCDDNNSDNEFTPKIIDCLHNIDAYKLLKINHLTEMKNRKISVIYLVIDGEFLSDWPKNLLETKHFKTGANILIGTMEDEGSFLLPVRFDSIKYNAITPQNLTYFEAYNELANICSNRYFRQPIYGGEVAKSYFTQFTPKTEDYDLLRRTIGIALGDYVLGCPTIHFAKTLFINDRNRTNVYQYYYNTKFSENIFCSKWMGAGHGSDLFPVFGSPILSPHNYSDAEIEQSLQFIEFFTHFAKYGYPSPQNGKDWPKYYTIDDNVIAPYFDLKNNKFRNELKHIECEILFKKYFV